MRRKERKAWRRGAGASNVDRSAEWRSVLFFLGRKGREILSPTMALGFSTRFGGGSRLRYGRASISCTLID